MKILFSLLAIIILSSLVFCQNKDTNPVLTIEGGKIIGVPTPTKGIIAYKGIPFAAPPIGDLRWKEPQAVVPWEGVKTADKYGAAAEQVTWDPAKFLRQRMACQRFCSIQRGLSVFEYLDSGCWSKG